MKGATSEVSTATGEPAAEIQPSRKCECIGQTHTDGHAKEEAGDEPRQAEAKEYVEHIRPDRVRDRHIAMPLACHKEGPHCVGHGRTSGQGGDSHHRWMDAPEVRDTGANIRVGRRMKGT